MKIIIVEDEIWIREGLEKLLYKISDCYEIQGTASNGEEGLCMVECLKPDLVITDIKMPCMDGLEMLTELRNRGISTQAIILSAYSDFSYAQKAMLLGVKEYILKPVDVGNFTDAMYRIERELTSMRMESQLLEQSFESALGNFLAHVDETDAEPILGILKRLGIREDLPAAEALFYLGIDYEKYHCNLTKKLRFLLSARKDFRSMIVEVPKFQLVIVIFPECLETEKVEKWLKYCIGLWQRDMIPYYVNCGWVTATFFILLHKAFYQLMPFMDWKIAQQDISFIRYQDVSVLQTKPCPPQVELERKMKAALCIYDKAKAQLLMEEFFAGITNGDLYLPKDIKEALVQFLWAIIATIKEIGVYDLRELSQQTLLNRITFAKNIEELIEIGNQVLLRTQHKQVQQDEKKISLMVTRASYLIQEKYFSGITLEEIARILHVTPEYLSSQFHKEMQITFGAYIKEYRIGQAKKMIIGSSTKLCTIANAVGYADAKYFSKVFKEFTGHLPTEYRRLYK